MGETTKILVTGGAGFIGSHVVDHLLDRSYAVRVLDNFATGKRANLEHVADQIEVMEGSINDDADLDAALQGVHAVIHLAAVPSVPKSMLEPVSTHAVNYTGTLQVLEAMRRAGVAKIIYASSAAVYSAEGDAPHHEEELPDPTSPYGVDKLAGEFLLKAYAKNYGLQTVALRFFNIYGERQDPTSTYSGVISVFADRLRRGQPITVFGDGSQTRDFVYVRDLAMVIAGLVGLEAPALMNVASGNSVTLLDLIRALGHALEVEPEVHFAEARTGDIRFSSADASRLATLGFVRWTSLPEGLAGLIARG